MKGRIVFKPDDTRLYFLDGQSCTEAEFNAAFPPAVEPDGPDAGSSLCGWKPIHSEAMAYHPKQVKEAEEHFRKLGIPTEIDRLGRPVLTSRSHRRKVMKSQGLHDNSGGYGDG